MPIDLFDLVVEARDRLRARGWRRMIDAAMYDWLDPAGQKFTEQEAFRHLERLEREEAAPQRQGKKEG